MPNTETLAARLPKVTLLYSSEAELRPLCYKLAYELSNNASELVTTAFRVPITDITSTLDNWTGNLNNEPWIDHLDPSRPRTKTTDLIDAFEQAIADVYGQDYLGKLSAHWLTSAYLDKARIIFYDATAPWIRTIVGVVEPSEYLILHLHHKLP